MFNIAACSALSKGVNSSRCIQINGENVLRTQKMMFGVKCNNNERPIFPFEKKAPQFSFKPVMLTNHSINKIFTQFSQSKFSSKEKEKEKNRGTNYETTDEYVKEKLAEIHADSSLLRFAKTNYEIPQQKLNQQNIFLFILFIVAVAFGIYYFSQEQTKNIGPYRTSFRILQISDIAKEHLGDNIKETSGIEYHRYQGNKIYLKVKVKGSKREGYLVSRSEYKAKEGSFLELYILLGDDNKKIYLQPPVAAFDRNEHHEIITAESKSTN